MSKIKLFIDAGHNNSSFNTGSEGNGMREQDISFEVAKLLGDILKDDFEIKLSRPTIETNLGTDNTSAINQRWQMANDWGADYSISIHANAGGGTGAETFYSREDAKNFATTVQDVYSSEMGLRNRRTEKRDNLAFLTNTNQPSILVELGFIDSPLTNPDVDILRNKRQEMAQAIADGIYKYFNMEPSKGTIKYNKLEEEENEVRFSNIDEVPSWGVGTVRKLVDKGFLQGEGNSLDLSQDMLRILVINDRAGLYDK